MRRKLGLILMGGAMLSISLIQFSVDGRGCVPSLLFTSDQTIVEVMKIMVTFKLFHAGTAALHCSAPTLEQATANPCLHWKLLDTHWHVWVSFLWSYRSFLLGLGAHKFLFVPSNCLLPQFCVSSGGSMVGLMVNFSKRAYAIPRSAAPRAPVAGHC